MDHNRQRFLFLARTLGSQKAAAKKLKDCGLSQSWLLKFLNRQVDNPSISSLDTLSAALDEIEKLQVA